MTLGQALDLHHAAFRYGARGELWITGVYQPGAKAVEDFAVRDASGETMFRLEPLTADDWKLEDWAPAKEGMLSA